MYEELQENRLLVLHGIEEMLEVADNGEEGLQKIVSLLIEVLSKNYGVPMNGRLEDLINDGYAVRIYVPFGPDWFDYSIRRLKENPEIAKYVLKNFFKNG